MTILTGLSLLLSSAAILFSTFALVVVRRSRAQSLLRQLSEHSTSIEELSLALRNMRARLNMQAYRARKAGKAESSNGDEPEETAQASKSWKDRMNLQLALRNLPK